MEFARAVSRKKRRITLVPLINVVFMLVFFFLIAGYQDNQPTLAVNLPEADAGQFLDEGPIEIILGRQHEIMLNKTYVMIEDFPTAIAQELAGNPERIITVKADAALEANRLVELMEYIEDAGGRHISVVTQARAAGQS
jgi:biopolymer transport protein ExbD